MVAVKKTAVIRATGNFVLRRLDPNAVTVKYQQGFFRTAIMPPHLRLRSITVTSIVATHGQGPDSETYVYRDKNNINQKILTTNHPICMGTRTPPYTCDSCRCSFNEEGVGVPLRMHKSENKIRVITDGDNCTFECALSQIRRFYPGNSKRKDPHYTESEQLLKTLYTMCHPGAPPLKEAKDTRLLRPNGPMEREEWLRDSHSYVKMAGIVIVPSKAQYLQTT